eukprot:scaffold852_cov197-Alexandrium_tamarense.AAC.10
MAKSKGAKIYAVAKGRRPGIYSTWAECEAQVKGFGGSVFKSFLTRYEAQSFIRSASAGTIVGSNPVPANSKPAAVNRPRAESHGSNNSVPFLLDADGLFVGHGCQEISDVNARMPKEVLDRDKSLSSLERATSVYRLSRLYAVAVGHQPGVYATWSECQKQVGSERNNIVPRAEPSKRICNTTPQLQITIYFDGGARGNPGVAGAGAEVVVVDSTANNQKTTYLIRQYCGDHETNNYAEYNGLIKGLQQAKAFVAEHIKKKKTGATPLFTLEVYGDSNLIIQQMRGNWKCKNDNIKPLYGQCLQLIKELQSMGANSEVSYDHVYRDQNKTTDELANEAMDQRRSWVTSNGTASASNAEEDGKMPAQRTRTEAVYSDDDDEGSTISC